MTNIITLTGVNKKYPETKKLAVEDISFSVLEGEFFCFVGPSGCGKSTILKLIAGIEEPSGGSIEKPDGISMVFQSGALLPWLTASENVGFGLKMRGDKKRDIREKTEKYLKLVKLDNFGSKYPRELSGGQRQRVGIARALSLEPEVLLLDEPFSALDPVTTEELHEDLLQIWNSTKTTIVMVSHLLEEAVFLADRVAIMTEGRIRKIVDVNLTRPRNIRGESFQTKEFEIRDILFGKRTSA